MKKSDKKQLIKTISELILTLTKLVSILIKLLKLQNDTHIIIKLSKIQGCISLMKSEIDNFFAIDNPVIKNTIIEYKNGVSMEHKILEMLIKKKI